MVSVELSLELNVELSPELSAKVRLTVGPVLRLTPLTETQFLTT